MIPCRTANAHDPCVGRVDAWQVPAPYRINELVARICKQENRPIGLDFDSDDAYMTMLLRTVNSAEAYSLSDTVDLMGADRPGSTPREPLLLKVWYEGESEERAAAVVEAKLRSQNCRQFSGFLDGTSRLHAV
jgi:hypothetical protein